MMRRRTFILAAAVFAACVAGLSGLPRVIVAESLPARLGDHDYWKLIADSSEPNGTFRSDNLLSNERWMQYVIPDLLLKVKPGRVYMGVGPEQNFTYIAALKPEMVFIPDIRRGNLDLQLMYKALFELSADRADFVAKLLSRPRPAGLTGKSSAAEIFMAFAAVDPSEPMLNATLASVRHQLTTVHRFPVADDDLMRIEAIARVFLLAGTRIQYSPYGSFGGTTQPTYAELMAAAEDSFDFHPGLVKPHPLYESLVALIPALLGVGAGALLRRAWR